MGAPFLNEEKIISEIIEREGYEFTNRPNDRGGATKYGVTQATLSAYLGRPATADMVRMLTEVTARAIYRQMFIQTPGFNRIQNDRVRVFVIDSGVQHGPEDPIRWMQRAVGVHVDGILGPVTAGAVNAFDQQALFAHLVACRIVHYGELITEDHSQAEFARGWMNRVAGFLEA